MGVVFQFFQLMPTLTVLENVMLPMQYCGTYKGQRRERAMEVLKLVEVPETADKYPSQISGGQQQRSAIARALVNDPDLHRRAMSRPATWTRSRPVWCSSSSRSWCGRARPSSWSRTTASWPAASRAWKRCATVFSWAPGRSTPG